MNIVIKIMDAIVKEHWPKLLHVLFATLAGAVIFPIAVVLTSLGGNERSPAILKLVIAIALLIPLLWPLKKFWSTGDIRAVSHCWYSIAPVAIIIAAILLLGLSEQTRPLGITLGLILDTVAVLIIGIFAFCQRFLYAALVEAPSSAKVDLADSEVEAKKVFRVVLAILAWEWFGAWYLVTFNSQLTVTTGIIAILSLGIIVFTSYSMGFTGQTGQKILMYSATAAFVVISLVLIDKAINDKALSEFLLGGYFGSALKHQTKIGIVGWITILVLIDLIGVTIAWLTQKLIISKLTFVAVMTLTVYLVGNWIVSTGFSLKDRINEISDYLDPHTATLPSNICITLILASIVGAIASVAGAITGIKKGELPAVSLAIFSICALVLYQLVLK